MLYPKILTTLKQYSKKDFMCDLTAGMVVGIIALPLAVAFSIAAGVSPEKGLIATVIGGFFISALGGSRVQIGGSTATTFLVVCGIVQKDGMTGLAAAVILAGILLVAMGAARMGIVIRFIPYPVMTGFTSGIAMIMFCAELKDFFGFPSPGTSRGFLAQATAVLTRLHTANFYALIIAITTLVLVICWPRVSRRVPGALMAILVCTVGARLLHWPIETIGTRFGHLPLTIQWPDFASLNFKMVKNIIPPAFTIALLIAMESLLSAAVADGMIGGKHRSNMELVAQGVANIFSGLFGGLPATGALARTATNVKNGGKTPVAGIIHCLTVLGIVLFLGPWVRFIPLACLAGILVVVCYHMSEWRPFLEILRGPRGDAIVLLATFFMTVFVDVTTAIVLGMALSILLLMRDMSGETQFQIISSQIKLYGSDEDEEKIHGADHELTQLPVPPGVELFEINGPLSFAVSHRFEETMSIIEKSPKVRILILRNVPAIDATGIKSLRESYQRCRRGMIQLIIAGVRAQPLRAMKDSGLYDLIDKKNIYRGIPQALKRAQELLMLPELIN